MGEVTGISWCDHTFNPWIGCQKVSPACDHCYAETINHRFGNDNWGPHAERRRTNANNWKQPIKWNAAAQKDQVKRRVFCASMADVFDNAVPPGWRDDLFALIDATPNLDWLLLTKRPQNIKKLAPAGFRENVWFGTTAEDQHHFDQRWPHLADIETKVRFLSYEPALGPLDNFGLHVERSPDWVICGGESGRGARPMKAAWVRSARDQCAAHGVPFHFKQWGAQQPGNELDGLHHLEFPRFIPAAGPGDE